MQLMAFSNEQLAPAARDAFLCRLIDHWEHRYAVWRRTESESEPLPSIRAIRSALRTLC
jgi:hypothetical protein